MGSSQLSIFNEFFLPFVNQQYVSVKKSVSQSVSHSLTHSLTHSRKMLLPQELSIFYNVMKTFAYVIAQTLGR